MRTAAPRRRCAQRRSAALLPAAADRPEVVSEAAAFIAWAKSYAAGIPDTVQTSPIGPSGSEQNGDVTFAAVARGAYGQGLPGAAPEAQGLQADQIVPHGRLEQVDLLDGSSQSRAELWRLRPEVRVRSAQDATARR